MVFALLLLWVATLVLGIGWFQRSKKLQTLLNQSHQNQMELEKKMQCFEQQKNEFFQNATHELSTPMKLIMGPLELAAKKYPDSPEIPIAIRSARRLDRLIEQLLDFQNLHFDRRPLKLQSLNLLPLLHSIEEYFIPSATSREVQFQLTLDEKPVSSRMLSERKVIIMGDVDALEKLCFHLLNHALHTSPNGSKIELGLTMTPGKVRLFAQDSGRFIPEADREKLFGAFQAKDRDLRAEADSDALDLALVKEWGEAMQGTVGMSSTANAGNSFWVEFPLIATPKGELDLLIVEDHEGLVRDFYLALEDAEMITSYRICPSAAEARDFLEKFDVNVLLADAELIGHEDGPSLLVYTAKHFPHTKRLLMTGKGLEANIEQAVNEGHITRVHFKPFNIRRLIGDLDILVLNRHQERQLNRPPIDLPFDTAEEEDIPRAGHLILVVDDQQDMRRMLGDVMHSMGHRVIYAKDGIQGLQVARLQQPQLIIADWVMPGMTGIELLEHLAKEPALASIPTILLTARDDEQSRSQAEILGAKAFIGKPFDPMELNTLVQALLPPPTHLRLISS